MPSLPMDEQHSLWLYYVLTNGVGVVLCALVMAIIYASPNKKAIDVLIAGLCRNCFLMSLNCCIECMLSMIYPGFLLNPTACWVEAYFHVSTIVSQFVSNGLIAYRYKLAFIDHKKEMSVRSAFALDYVALGLCFGITALIGNYSEWYLLPAMTFCFYSFSSPAIKYWFVPVLLIITVFTIYVYIRIYKHLYRELTELASKKSLASTASSPTSCLKKEELPVLNEEVVGGIDGSSSSKRPKPIPGIDVVNIRKLYSSQSSSSFFKTEHSSTVKTAHSSTVLTGSPVNNTTKPPVSPSSTEKLADMHYRDTVTLKIAEKSFVFVLIFTVLWFPGVVACFYEIFSSNRITKEFDSTVGVLGSLHSIIVPVFYCFQTSCVYDWLKGKHVSAIFTGGRWSRNSAVGRKTRDTVVQSMVISNTEETGGEESLAVM